MNAVVVTFQVCCVLLVCQAAADEFLDSDEDVTVELVDEGKDCMPKRGNRPGNGNRPGTGNRPGGGTPPVPPGGGTPPVPPGGGVPPGPPPPGGFPPGEVPPGGEPPSGGFPPGGAPPGGAPPGFPYSEPDAVPTKVRQRQRSNSTSKSSRTRRRKSKKSGWIERIPPDCQDYHRKLRMVMRDVRREDSDCGGGHECLRSLLAAANKRVQAEERADGSLCGPILMQLHEQQWKIDDEDEDDE